MAGLLFMSVSGGLSLGLTIAGAGTGLAAGGITTGSDIYKKKKQRKGFDGYISTKNQSHTGQKQVLNPPRKKKDDIKSRLEQMDQRDQILMIVSS